MKINIDIDCTPEEARAFLGLPEVAPMQAALMEKVQERLMANLSAMDPETLFETWLPASLQGWEQIQKAFWSQFAEELHWIRRWEHVVQGESAATQIRAALARVIDHGECDVVLLVRGGGSLEDLWCFNDEALARDIAAFPLPLVTGIGHEIDFTIADFVADQRAPTPSVAAESVTPDINELLQGIDERVARLRARVETGLERARERLGYLQKALRQQHPERQLEQLRLRLRHASRSLLERLRYRLGEDRHRLRLARAGLERADPRIQVARRQQQLSHLIENHLAAMRQTLLMARHRLSLQQQTLATLDPDRTLARGYARISKGEMLVTSATQLKRDDDVRIKLADGSADARIK